LKIGRKNKEITLLLVIYIFFIRFGMLFLTHLGHNWLGVRCFFLLLS